MPNDKLKYLGQRMKEARTTAHLTQEELSDKSHVSVRQIAKIEKGVMNPSYEILYALIHALGVSPNILFHSGISENERVKQEILGYIEICNSEDRQLILQTVQCLSLALSNRYSDKESQFYKQKQSD